MSYKEKVLPIIRQVREFVLPSWGVASIVNEKSIHPADVVTEIDTKVEEFLKEKLAEVYPDIEFAGEEGGGKRDMERFWLVDPIDGTGHYVRGLPFCTVMIALIEHGVVTFSAIYDFINDDMYWAEKGKGAYKNDTPIHVSNRNLQQSYLGWESKDIEKKENFSKFVEINKLGNFRSISAGWEFAMIASGKLDARISFNPWGKDWDFAPGLLLVAEAGGVSTNIGSDKYDYRNTDLIAGNPIVHKELQEMFKDYYTPQ